MNCSELKSASHYFTIVSSNDWRINGEKVDYLNNYCSNRWLYNTIIYLNYASNVVSGDRPITHLCIINHCLFALMTDWISITSSRPRHVNKYVRKIELCSDMFFFFDRLLVMVLFHIQTESWSAGVVGQLRVLVVCLVNILVLYKENWMIDWSSVTMTHLEDNTISFHNV